MHADIKFIRKTNELVYATATVVLELLGYTVSSRICAEKKCTASILAPMKRYTRIYIDNIDPKVGIGIGYILA